MDANCLCPWTKQLLSHPKPYCELGAVDSRWVCIYMRVAISALLTMPTWLSTPLLQRFFACWRPQGKLYLFGRIYIFYSWGGHHFHFPESQSLPISQSTSFGSKLTPWLGLSGTEGKWQDMSDKLRDEATTGIDKGAGERASAVLLGDAGGWHCRLERCWWCSERFVLFLLDHCQCPLCKK